MKSDYWLKWAENNSGLLHVDASNPVHFEDESCCYYVHSGQVDIFLAASDANGPAGALHFVASVKEGYFFLPLVSGDEQMVFYGYGTINTQLVAVPFNTFWEKCTEEDSKDYLKDISSFWHTVLSNGGISLRHRNWQEISGPQSAALAAGNQFIGKGPLVGSRILSGRVSLGAVSGIEFKKGELIPVSDHIGYRAEEETSLEIVPGLAQLSAQSASELCRCFQSALVQIVVKSREAKEQHQQKLTQKRLQLNQRKLSDLRHRFSGMLKFVPGRSDSSPSAGNFMAPFQIVGEHEGLSFSRPTQIPIAARYNTLNFIRYVADYSRIRYRKILLDGPWWQERFGAFIGVDATTKRPVALVPGRRGYELYEAEKQSLTRVTEAVAKNLLPYGYEFYRPFPDGPVSLSGMLKYMTHAAWREMIKIPVYGLLAGLISMVTPIASGILFNSVVPSAEFFQLYQLGIFLVTFTLTSQVLKFMQQLAVLRLEGLCGMGLESALWDRLLSLPAPFFKRFTSGDLARRSLGISSIQHILSNVVVSSALSFIFSFFNLILMFYYDSKLAIAGLAIVFVSCLLMTGLAYWSYSYERQIYSLQGKLSGLMTQLIAGIQKLKIAGAEVRAIHQWGMLYAQKKQVTFQAGMVGNWLAILSAIIGVAPMFVFFILVAENKYSLPVGSFIAFTSAFGVVSSALTTLIHGSIKSLMSVIPLYKRLKPILMETPEIDSLKASPGDLSGNIELHQVRFKYNEDSPTILRDITLSVNKGEFVALVGTSGSGKSTIFRIMLGFEKPSAGSVFYDGRDISQIDIHALRRQVGVVLQDDELIPGSILENITGTANVSMDQAWEAARMAGCAEDIKNMAMGMHTVVSEGGGGFSGGQRQRIIIARSLVKKPQILFFDEATSALDNRTQAIVSRSLEQLRTTRVVIAHRLSTIEKADKIYVLDKGRIVQQGTYRELIKQEGLFAELAKRQVG